MSDLDLHINCEYGILTINDFHAGRGVVVKDITELVKPLAPKDEYHFSLSRLESETEILIWLPLILEQNPFLHTLFYGEKVDNVLFFKGLLSLKLTILHFYYPFDIDANIVLRDSLFSPLLVNIHLKSFNFVCSTHIPLKSLKRVLKTGTNLRTLSVGGNLRKSQLKQLFDGLRHNTTLSELKLVFQDNWKVVPHLSELFSGDSTNIRQLTIHGGDNDMEDRIFPYHEYTLSDFMDRLEYSLENLSLKFRMTDDNAISFTKMLSRLRIPSISLAFCNTLLVSELSKVLEKERGFLTILDLDIEDDCSPEEITRLLRSLTFHNLVSLRLSSRYQTDFCFDSFLSLLKVSRQLKVLKVYPDTNEQVLGLLDVLDQMENLTEIMVGLYDGTIDSQTRILCKRECKRIKQRNKHNLTMKKSLLCKSLSHRCNREC